MSTKEIPEHIIEYLAAGLLPIIQAFYESPEGQAEFERWKAAQSEPEKTE